MALLVDGLGVKAAPAAMRLLMVLSLLGCPPAAYGLKLRILGTAEELQRGFKPSFGAVNPEDLQRQVGDGVGRALYQINTVEMPTNRSVKHCLNVRMDRITHSINVDGAVKDDNTVAYGCFDDTINSTGWASLEIVTTESQDVPLAVRSYCAGLVEGLLTAKRLVQFHGNVLDLMMMDIGTDKAAQKVVDQALRLTLIAWEEFTGGDAMSEPVEELPKQAWAALMQLRGIRDGNNLLIAEDGVEYLSAYQVMLTNMHAEIPALVELYARSEQAKLLTSLLQTGSKTRTNRSGSSSAGSGETQAQTRTWARWAAHMPKGAAIVRRTGALGTPEDLLAGHVTNGEYGEMLRIMKTYRLHFGTAVSDVTMSSYPGCVSSTDDYFVTGTGFVAMSTSLWLPSEGADSRPPLTSEGLPSFLRAIMATRLATQPRMWAKVYGYLTGIAGAKQWLIVDYSKFKSLQPLADDTLWMVESLPRVQRANDVTHVLREGGFFEAHGVPHFHDIRLIYGLPAEGPGAYEEFRQAALLDKGATIANLPTARQVLTEMKTSRNSQIPIAARKDLDPSQPIPAGSIDAKVTSRCLVLRLGLQARSSPPVTPGGGVFSWEDADGMPRFPGWPRRGMGAQWNHSWVSAVPGELKFPIVPAMSECENTA